MKVVRKWAVGAVENVDERGQVIVVAEKEEAGGRASSLPNSIVPRRSPRGSVHDAGPGPSD